MLELRGYPDAIHPHRPSEDEDSIEGQYEAASLSLVTTGMQLTERGAYAGAAVMQQFSSGSTLLPQNVADLVTNLALLARVSLKSSAFFIEVILEAAKYGTGMGLGLTRRALISAVGTARAVHALKNGEEWDAKKAGRSALKGVQAIARADQKAAFLSVLDRYTALGVYLIHHTFTLAELFAQSGFYLADQSIKVGFSAADESVRVIDGIFGSTETSRALSSFITMIKSELGNDEMLKQHTGGGIWTLTALTKALTTFAVLQNATFRRTAKTQKTRVLYDCLVLGEAETKSWRAQIVGSGNFIKKALPALPSPIPPRGSSSSSKTTQAVSPGRSRLLSSSGSVRSGMGSMRRSRSIFGVDEPCILDVEEGEEGNLSGDADESMLLEDLDYLVGAVEEDDTLDGVMTPSNKVVASSQLCHEDLSADMKASISQASPDELDRGLIVHGSGGDSEVRPRDVRHVVRRKSDGKAGGTAVYEITTEMTEVIEETTTTTMMRSSSPSRGKKESSKMRRLPNPFGAFRMERERVLPSAEEEGWCAVEAFSSGDAEYAARPKRIPEVPNGQAAAVVGGRNVAAAARKDALHHPEESRQRMQEVVRTITKRLVQKKRVVQRVQVEDADEEEEEADTSLGSDGPTRSAKRKGTETPKSDATEGTSPSRKSAEGGSGLQKAISKAKNSFGGSSTPRQALAPYRENLSVPPSSSNGKTASNSKLPGSPLDKQLPLPPDSGNRAGSIRHKRRSRVPSIGSIRSFASHTHMQMQSTTTTRGNNTDQEEGPNGAPGAFPRQHFVKNLRRFMRHSSAAYGQNFMRVLGIGETQYLFADTRERSANIFAYAHHVGIPPDAVLLSSFCEGSGGLPFHSDKMAPIVNYISRDDVSKAIVLTCRGTLGLSDVLTDLTCSFVDVRVDNGNPHHSYQVHSGMLASAQRLAKPGSTVLETLKTALEANPDYGLVLTGHSLGGGVASLLAMQLSSPSHVFQEQMLAQMGSSSKSSIRHPKLVTPFVTGLRSGLPPGRPIHSYAYGCPAIASADLSRYCKGLCTTVVHGFDIVPCLSLGTLHDLKAVACSLSDEKESIMAQEIVGRVVGLYQKKKKRAKEQVAAAAQAKKPLASEEAFDEDHNYLPIEGDIPRPTELPLHERNLHINVEELAQGRTKNRAVEANYEDPIHSEEGRSGQHRHQGGKKEDDEDNDLSDWLWSLIKTMRAGMDSDKLYPPGTIYMLEMRQVHVTAQMSAAQQDMFMKNGQRQGIQSNRAEAARVIVRLVEDVTSRFGEPIFARSLFRDHLPTNYELVTQLLWEAVVPQDEQERVEANESQAAASCSPPTSA